ncbi:hypothetical protein J6590_087621 [Homalodisca vitripennis]|nr:hypothetical protein J6590_087621 [Homalodisca vitripennis]
MHLGNELLFQRSINAIDTILITGDSIYNTLRDENRMGGNRYLCPDELLSDFTAKHFRSRKEMVLRNGDRMYRHVYSLDDPIQRFGTASGEVQFVNRCRQCIEERKIKAMRRSLNADITDAITNHLYSFNPHVREFRQVSNQPSFNAHHSFQLTSGLKCTLCLGLTTQLLSPVWKVGAGRQSTIDLCRLLMESFQYPLAYQRGTLSWYIGMVDNNGKNSRYNYARCLLLSDYRFSRLGRLSQAWQVEMFARLEEERKLNAQLNGLAGRQIKYYIAGDETVQDQGEALRGKVNEDSLREHDGFRNTLEFTTAFLYVHVQHKFGESKRACSKGSGCSDSCSACGFFQIKLLELLRDLRRRAIFGCTNYVAYITLCK